MKNLRRGGPRRALTPPKPWPKEKPDDSKWFLTDRPLSVFQLVAELRRHPNLDALLSRTAREWLRHRDLRPDSLPVPKVEGRRLPGHSDAALAPEELLDFLWPHRKERVEEFLDQLAQAWGMSEKKTKASKQRPPG